MKSQISLDDIVLFLAVADHGSLSGAAQQTGNSVPTLGRRMTALETALGMRLFQRGPRGYTLTASGVALRDEATDLHALSGRLNAFKSSNKRPRVRITAGFWTSEFLIRHLSRFWNADMDWVPEFLPSRMMLDIARREADIGIRNRRPDQSWLAGQSTSRIRYAPFAHSRPASGWVTLPEDASQTASQNWVRRHHRKDIVTTASDPRLALDIVASGIGQMVLPTFVGQAHKLAQSGPDIEELAHEEWLVSHHEARHDPPIRQALNGISAILCDRALRPR
jgi:DNA-binding transcriptional LysR family regulator